METNKGGKYPAPSFSTENEPFYDLLKTGNNANQQSSLSGVATNPVDFGENILPSYDFHPTRPAPSLNNGNKMMSPTLSEQSLDGKSSTSEPLHGKQERSVADVDDSKDAVAAVERTMKKYADNLLRVLEDMRGKLTQLERTTDRLESTVAELQNRSADQHGELDGRVRGLEHVLREVQRGVQLLRDKSELQEAQAELAKMQMTTTAAKPPLPAQAPPALTAPPQTFPALTAPPLVPEEPAKPAAPMQMQPQPQVEQQPAPAPVPLPSAPSAPPQQLSVPVPQYQAPPKPPASPHPRHPPQPQQPQGPSGPAPRPRQYGPQAPPYMQRPPPQQQQEAPAYLPQGYGQQAGAPPHQMPPPPPQPQQGPPRQGYEGAPPQGAPHPGGRLALPPPPGSYGPPPPQGYSERPGSTGGYDRPPSASYDRPPTSGYERQAPPPFERPPPPNYDRQSGYEPRVPASPYGPPPQYGAGGPPPAPGTYPRLQMAQPVQSSEPPRTAGSGGPAQLSTSKMPIEQVIDDVAAMGFHKDEVRSIVRQLTETGKSVDLNIVLDTLMTRSGGAAPTGRSW
ncbi:hypothetical protein KFL_004450030 [Klebsormidium nitens]|uniref:DUF1421 domain-containing protein n=1 Tax=Klebsormidium nitens TaxID=105231 RepID=A0A1Y1IIT7_KLENI|nr:hypothetical protein KFL_004450030 [Klebsormidium nitens]|eukprot:GAQ88616.1 hypothetical protein KFL_004450030 [Klebsormidium nitens]